MQRQLFAHVQTTRITVNSSTLLGVRGSHKVASAWAAGAGRGPDSGDVCSQRCTARGRVKMVPRCEREDRVTCIEIGYEMCSELIARRLN